MRVFACSSLALLARCARSSIVLAALVVACGGSSNDDTTSDTSPTSPADCASTTAALCERACACSSNGECTIRYPNASETHASLTDCKNFYAYLGCGDAKVKATFEEGACSAAAKNATCSAAKDGVTYPADACRRTP